MSDGKSLLLAILRADLDEGGSGLSTTVLTKVVYLADYYASLKSKDFNLFVPDWRFLHFGPYSNTLADSINSLEQAGAIIIQEMEHHIDGDSRLRIHKLPEFHRAPTLRDLGLPAGVALRIEAAIKKYRYATPELLNFIYFETLPMQNAKPGDLLIFPSPQDDIQKEDFRTFSWPMGKSKKETIKLRLAAIGQKTRSQREAASTANSYAIFDEHYTNFLSDISPIEAEGYEELSARAYLDLYD